jgi:hypothetical protein
MGLGLASLSPLGMLQAIPVQATLQDTIALSHVTLIVHAELISCQCDMAQHALQVDVSTGLPCSI